MTTWKTSFLQPSNLDTDDSDKENNNESHPEDHDNTSCKIFYGTLNLFLESYINPMSSVTMIFTKVQKHLTLHLLLVRAVINMNRH